MRFLGTLHIVKILLTKANGELQAAAEAVTWNRRSLTHLFTSEGSHCCVGLVNFIVFMALITESQSDFEGSERVKRFTQDFLKSHRAFFARKFAECDG